MHPIYLDHAAATPLDPEVAAAIARAQAEAFANPSSQHAAGRVARRLLEDARERIMALLGGRLTGPARDRLVFTSGASEANHLALLGMSAACAVPGTVRFSRRDHAGSARAVAALGRRGWTVEELPLDTMHGTAAAALARRPQAAGTTTLVSLTLVCGQTGSIEDLAAIAAEPRSHLHVDATQAAAWLPLDFSALPAATLALAPHKFGGPRGIGALLVRAGTAIEPVQRGTQEQELRGGTEAVALAVGFAVSLEKACAARDRAVRHVEAVRDALETRLVAVARGAGVPATVVAAAGRRAPHISTIGFVGLDREALAMAADLAGVCLGTGSACASGSSEPAPALLAMGLPSEVVRGALRFSCGPTTTPEEIDLAVARFTPLLRRRGA